MYSFKTEQEAFWHGSFGNDYVDRNDSQHLLATKTAKFAKILSRCSLKNIASAIEFGSNVGLNIFALKRLMSDCQMSAIEINERAASILRERYAASFGNDIKIYNKSILEWDVDFKRDLVLISGVLIHINPESLQEVYQRLYDASQKYIIVSEYYNPTPVEVLYRGNTGKLFKRDFAGEMLDKFPDLKLIDYGFIYHRDNAFPVDDGTWFLLEK